MDIQIHYQVSQIHDSCGGSKKIGGTGIILFTMIDCSTAKVTVILEYFDH